MSEAEKQVAIEMLGELERQVDVLSATLASNDRAVIDGELNRLLSNLSQPSQDQTGVTNEIHRAFVRNATFDSIKILSKLPQLELQVWPEKLYEVKKLLSHARQSLSEWHW